MSVLIRGMRFPKTCDECLINCGRSMLYIGITDRRSPDCPLVEIPTPHGRLIDVDRIEYENVYFEDVGESYEIVGKDDIDDAETVIEAEGSEE